MCSGAGSTKDMFEYAGYGRIQEVFGSAPVGIRWSFDNPPSDSALLRKLGEAAGLVEVDPILQHEFQVGDRVNHPELGFGRVLAISGSELSAPAIIYFATVGERRETPLSEVERMAGFGSAPR